MIMKFQTYVSNSRWTNKFDLDST